MYAIAYSRKEDSPELNNYAAVYGDLCTKYFRLRKDGDDERRVVLNINSSWLSNADTIL